MEYFPDTIRIDRNLASNSLEWLNQFKEDSRLCFDIILYISNNMQRDLFNYGVIDLNHFAKTMGYKKNNLQAITEPIQKELTGPIFNSLEREQKFITVFENALFKLGRFNIPVESVSIDTTTNEKILQTHFIQILKEISINIKGNTTRSKILYSYRTSEEFDYNLSRLFFLADFSKISELRGKNLLLLYFYLKSIENSKKEFWIEKDFVKLCNLANIQMDTSTEPDPSNKRKIKDSKDKLKRRKLSLMKNYINFEFEDINVSGRFRYGFKFHFPQNASVEDKSTKNQIELDTIALLNKSAFEYIMTKVVKHYRNSDKLKVDNDKVKFKAWFLDHSRDFDNKQNIYFSGIAKMHNISVEVAKKRHSKHCMEFFSSLPEKEYF